MRRTSIVWFTSLALTVGCGPRVIQTIRDDASLVDADSTDASVDSGIEADAGIAADAGADDAGTVVTPIPCSSDADCATGLYCAGLACALKKPDGDACTTANECDSGACTTFYVDNDGDFQGAGPGTTLCGVNLAGSIANATDCCDTDANVFAGQTMFFQSANACGGFDYDCSGATTQEFELSATCEETTGLRCATCITDGIAGWASHVPGCGSTSSFIDRCGRGAPVCPAGSAPACAVVSSLRAQRCR